MTDFPVGEPAIPQRMPFPGGERLAGKDPDITLKFSHYQRSCSLRQSPIDEEASP